MRYGVNHGGSYADWAPVPTFGTNGTVTLSSDAANKYFVAGRYATIGGISYIYVAVKQDGVFRMFADTGVLDTSWTNHTASTDPIGFGVDWRGRVYVVDGTTRVISVSNDNGGTGIANFATVNSTDLLVSATIVSN